MYFFIKEREELNSPQRGGTIGAQALSQHLQAKQGRRGGAAGLAVAGGLRGG